MVSECEGSDSEKVLKTCVNFDTVGEEEADFCGRDEAVLVDDSDPSNESDPDSDEFLKEVDKVKEPADSEVVSEKVTDEWDSSVDVCDDVGVSVGLLVNDGVTGIEQFWPVNPPMQTHSGLLVPCPRQSP